MRAFWGPMLTTCCLCWIWFLCVGGRCPFTPLPGTPIVVVMVNGGPLALADDEGDVTDLVHAVIEAWYGGEEAGSGVADVRAECAGVHVCGGTQQSLTCCVCVCARVRACVCVCVCVCLCNYVRARLRAICAFV